MPEWILTLPTRLRARLTAGAPSERIGLLAGLFLLVSLLARAALAVVTGVSVEWSIRVGAGLGIRALLIGTATHYLEAKGWFSFRPPE